MIKGVHKVVVPVDDLDEARRFWTTRLGFDVLIDEPYPSGRWLEVGAPADGVRLVLTARDPGETRRKVSEELPHSDVFFACNDIEKTYAELKGRGVHFHTPPVKMPFGWWSMFEDQDGTRYVLTESQ